MSLPFVKAQAHGNDFLIVCDAEVKEASPSLAVAMCDRRRGIGADGLILYRAEGERFTMTLVNSDGSSAEVSGNGLRCLAAHLLHASMARGPKMEIETGAGKLRLEALERAGTTFRFRADMGPPREVSRDVAIDVGGRVVAATTVSMGNPHCVVFTDRAELATLGPLLERHPDFPEHTNVEIVEVLDRHTLGMVIWERGAGETASSGTGSSASAVAAIVHGLVESPVAVHCPGGMLEVSWTDGESVFLTGEAVVVAEGTYWRSA